MLDFTYDNAGMPYSLIYNNGTTTATYYYITNLQGDVMYLVDANGNEVAAYDYDPYGKIISATGELAGINPLRYRGYYYDSETGFYYLQSRYYDPEICRFINADSYASTGQSLLGYNMLAYCGNAPINKIDPDGRDAIILYDSGFPGHIGALVQDEDGSWYHFYWGSSGFWTRLGCAISLDVTPTTWCKEYSGTIDLTSINSANQFSGDYEKMLYLEGDFASCISEMKAPDGKYNLYRNNCSQKTLRILASAETKYSDILRYASKDFFPSSAYKKISKNINKTNSQRVSNCYRSSKMRLCIQ